MINIYDLFKLSVYSSVMLVMIVLLAKITFHHTSPAIVRQEAVYKSINAVPRFIELTPGTGVGNY
jgi:hypothetical protein